ncbi:UNVERIFIED_CONTAM: hypothetical protein FKN15_005530 [Acipenser sinensis]
MKSGKAGKGYGRGATACVRNTDRRGSAAVIQGMCKKVAACPISANIELESGGTLASDATLELGSTSLESAGSSPSSISVGKEPSPQEAAIDIMSSSAISDGASRSPLALLGEIGASTGVGADGAEDVAGAAGPCCLDKSSRTRAICALKSIMSLACFEHLTCLACGDGERLQGVDTQACMQGISCEGLWDKRRSGGTEAPRAADSSASGLSVHPRGPI